MSKIISSQQVIEGPDVIRFADTVFTSEIKTPETMALVAMILEKYAGHSQVNQWLKRQGYDDLATRNNEDTSLMDSVYFISLFSLQEEIPSQPLSSLIMRIIKQGMMAKTIAILHKSHFLEALYRWVKSTSEDLSHASLQQQFFLAAFYQALIFRPLSAVDWLVQMHEHGHRFDEAIYLDLQNAIVCSSRKLIEHYSVMRLKLDSRGYTPTPKTLTAFASLALSGHSREPEHAVSEADFGFILDTLRRDLPATCAESSSHTIIKAMMQYYTIPPPYNITLHMRASRILMAFPSPAAAQVVFDYLLTHHQFESLEQFIPAVYLSRTVPPTLNVILTYAKILHSPDVRANSIRPLLLALDPSEHMNPLFGNFVAQVCSHGDSPDEFIIKLLETGYRPSFNILSRLIKAQARLPWDVLSIRHNLGITSSHYLELMKALDVSALLSLQQRLAQSIKIDKATYTYLIGRYASAGHVAAIRILINDGTPEHVTMSQIINILGKYPNMPLRVADLEHFARHLPSDPEGFLHENLNDLALASNLFEHSRSIINHAIEHGSPEPVVLRMKANLLFTSAAANGESFASTVGSYITSDDLSQPIIRHAICYGLTQEASSHLASQIVPGIIDRISQDEAAYFIAHLDDDFAGLNAFFVSELSSHAIMSIILALCDRRHSASRALEANPTSERLLATKTDLAARIDQWAAKLCSSSPSLHQVEKVISRIGFRNLEVRSKAMSELADYAQSLVMRDSNIVVDRRLASTNLVPRLLFHFYLLGGQYDLAVRLALSMRDSQDKWNAIDRLSSINNETLLRSLGASSTITQRHIDELIGHMTLFQPKSARRIYALLASGELDSVRFKITPSIDNMIQLAQARNWVPANHNKTAITYLAIIRYKLAHQELSYDELMATLEEVADSGLKFTGQDYITLFAMMCEAPSTLMNLYKMVDSLFQIAQPVLKDQDLLDEAINLLASNGFAQYLNMAERAIQDNKSRPSLLVLSALIHKYKSPYNRLGLSTVQQLMMRHYPTVHHNDGKIDSVTKMEERKANFTVFQNVVGSSTTTSK
eukprot:gene6701-7793_t